MWTHPGKLAIAFLLLGAVMYFGLSIEPREIKAPEEKMQASAFRKGLNEETLQKAMAELEPVQKAEVETLMKDLQNAASDSVRLPLLKRLSGVWYDHGRYELSGDYATMVAGISKTADAWGIAGTSYLQGIDPEVPDAAICRDKALVSFDKAIRLNPENPQHRMNKALCLVRMPGENPMEGIMMLRELDQQHPDYLPVQLTLSQLAIQTGQLDKAYDRVKRNLVKHPDDKDLNCLMIELIRQTGKNEPTAALEKICGH
ncbi:MAG: hypothetical protein U0V49_00620 [Saprospiraceae bacterium]